MSGAGDGSGASSRVVALRADRERHFTSNLGMVVFLASWAMMFGALFFSYALLRLRAATWPPPGSSEPPFLLPALTTAVIVFSSGTLVLGGRSFRRGSVHGLGAWLAATLALGLVFCGLQAVTWWRLWHEGLTWGRDAYGSVLWTLNGFHALHVVVGLGFLGWLLVRTLRRNVTPRDGAWVENVAMFWHFVDVVWLIIYASVYLL